MAEKLDSALRERLARRDASAERLPVIVKLSKDASVRTLEACGLTVIHRFESISRVSGTIRAADVENLERLPEVEQVEFDGQMHAF